MKITLAIFTSVMIAIACCGDNAVGQSSLSRPCPGRTPTPARSRIDLEKDGDIAVISCSGRSINIGASESLYWDEQLKRLRIYDKQFENFQSAATYLSVGNRPNQPIANTGVGAGIYAVDVEPTFSGDGNAVGVFSFARASSSSASSGGGALIGLHGIASNVGDLAAGRILTGVRGEAYQRSQPGSAAAYGGYFSAFTGGNLGLTNPTPIYGIYAEANGGHNGTTPLAVAGKFKVTNIGGGGQGNITLGVGVHAMFDAFPAFTDIATARGFSCQDWVLAPGHMTGTSTCLYIDASVDQAPISYPIQSLSTSPVLLTGDVFVNDHTKGLILKSPDGTCYRFTVANGGALSAGASVTCP